MAKNSSVTTLDDAPVQAAEQAAAAAQEATIIGKNSDPELSGKTAVISIHVSDTEDGTQPVFVGLNGYGYQIPRGINCRVPVEVIAILQNAVKKVYPTNGGLVIGEREVPRYGFNVISQG